MNTIVFSAKDIDKEICKLYNLDDFNCLVALFGRKYQKDATYVLTITKQKIQNLKELESEFFELYVKHCRMIYEYFWNKGYQNTSIYIKP